MSYHLLRQARPEDMRRITSVGMLGCRDVACCLCVSYESSRGWVNGSWPPERYAPMYGESSRHPPAHHSKRSLEEVQVAKPDEVQHRRLQDGSVQFNVAPCGAHLPCTRACRGILSGRRSGQGGTLRQDDASQSQAEQQPRPSARGHTNMHGEGALRPVLDPRADIEPQRNSKQVKIEPAGRRHNPNLAIAYK